MSKSFLGGPIRLGDGKPSSFPTCYSGSVRIRALEPRYIPEQGQVFLNLEARAEPRMMLLGIHEVRVEKALDDHNQRLEQEVDVRPVAGVNARARGVRSGLRTVVFSLNGQRTVVHFKKTDKKTNTLKELSGTLQVEALLPPEPAVQVDDLLKAEGRTFKGKDGTTLVIKNISFDEKGILQMQAETTTPFTDEAVAPLFRPDGTPVLPALPPVQAPQGGDPFPAQPAVPLGVQAPMRPAGRTVTLANDSLSFWVLQDDKGQMIRLLGPINSSTGVMNQMGRNLIAEHNVVFRLPEKQVPARLVYSRSRSAILSIPFWLKDISVP